MSRLINVLLVGGAIYMVHLASVFVEKMGTFIFLITIFIILSGLGGLMLLGYGMGAKKHG